MNWNQVIDDNVLVNDNFNCNNNTTTNTTGK